jgi:signal transduction histidine kinase
LVKLADQAAGITLDISDNGIGISEGQMNKSNSFGLLGMRERVHILNGEVRIKGSKNTGTSIKIILPKTANVLT